MLKKAKAYKVEAIDVQGKVAATDTFSTQTGAMTFANMHLGKPKIKCVRINGKVWRKSRRK